MGRTSIEWTHADGFDGRSWNPVTGCKKVGPGCRLCYAHAIAERFRGTKAFPHGFDLHLRPERMMEPYRWRKPARVFVNSMSDLFWKQVPMEYVDKVFSVMEQTPQHTYLVLTKRSSRMQKYVGRRYTAFGESVPGHIWLGVSVESQQQIARISHLPTGEANCFISFEPLLEWMGFDLNLAGVKWAIVGGESGRDAMYMDDEWVRNIRRHCRKYGVALFVKQMGTRWMRKHRRKNSKGSRLDDLPMDLRIREIPQGSTKTAPKT